MTEASKAKRPTSVDVAREAGLSRTTVSYVLNDVPHQKIPEATRQRVLEAANRLGYAPSAAARALRSGRSDVVLCLLPDWPIGTGVSNMLEHMSGAFEKHGLTFVAHPRAETTRPISQIWRAITPAAVVTFEDPSDEDAAAMEAAGIDLSIVLFSQNERRRGEMAAPEQQIGRMQVEHLASVGHRGIGYAYPDDPRLGPFAVARLDGVRQMCAELGLDEPVVVVVPLDGARAATAMAEWSSPESSVTAVCGYNDESAMAVLAGMAHLGLTAPGDLAVIGVDDIPGAALTVPPLTTVTHDFAAFARRLADNVARGLDGRPALRRPMRGATEVLLVVRESA